MTERKEGLEINTSQTPLLPKPNQLTPIQPMQQFTQPQPGMQSPATVPQASPQQVQPQQGNITPVMQQTPQTAPSPHAVAANNMQAQNAQFYVQTSLATGMQAPHAIAPAPGPQATTTSVSALHQPLQHQLAPPQMNHPGVSPSPMPQQFSPQLQVIQGGLPGGHYVYQNAQGQFIMPGNLTLQTAPGMNNQIQQSAINSLNPPIQVITAGKPFQGQIAPHMIAGGKSVLQAGAQPAGGYNPSSIPTSGGNQTVLISQLGGNPTLGVISSQTQNILPAQSSAPKPGELQKVNNMQTFGQIPQGITWASPGALQSQTLLAGQNPQIFIRGAQPGSEGIFIQNHQPQQMAPQNSMVSPIASMPMNVQQAKPRTGLEVQANIQPKVTTMRPAILPSLNPQLRPGASVSTQTAVGQTITQQMGTRPPGGGRSRDSMGRAPAAIAMQPGHSIIQSQQVIQPHTTPGMSPVTSFAASANSMTLMSPSTSITFNPNKPHTTESTNALQTQRMNSPMQSSPITMGNQAVYAKGPSHTPSPQAMPVGNQQIPMVASTGQIVNPQSMQQNMQPMTPQVAAATTSTTVSSGVAVSLQTQTMASHTAPTQTIPIRPNAAPQKPPTPHSMAPSSKSETRPSVSSAQMGAADSGHINGQVSTEKKLDSEKGNPSVNGINVNTNKNTVQMKAPPKAMVKPHVMTHVVEGFVIHEASQPFPVTRNSRLNEMSKDRQQTNNTATVAPQVPHVETNSDDSTHKQDSPKDLIRCEGCGKTDQRSKFKKHKKFCSSACSKRIRSDNDLEESNKILKLDSESASILTSNPVTSQVPDAIQTEDGEPKVDILKWTVKDVVDFIQNLPGCQDYAEDFELQEIDGQALMLLKADHLMSAMSIKLGPALKICDKIEAIRSDKKEP